MSTSDKKSAPEKSFSIFGDLLVPINRSGPSSHSTSRPGPCLGNRIRKNPKSDEQTKGANRGLAQGIATGPDMGGNNITESQSMPLNIDATEGGVHPVSPSPVKAWALVSRLGQPSVDNSQFPALGADPGTKGDRHRNRLQRPQRQADGLNVLPASSYAEAASRPAKLTKNPPVTVPNPWDAPDFSSSCTRRAYTASLVSTSSTHRSRDSARIRLRPSRLLPYVPTGANSSACYYTNREESFSEQTKRNASYVKANNAYRAHNGAGAREQSQHAKRYSYLQEESSRMAAGNIFQERRDTLMYKVIEFERGGPGSGTLIGAGYGVLLGNSQYGRGGRRGRPSVEDMEAAIDLHVLHAHEAILFLEPFLTGLQKEHFRGLAYALVGVERHTGEGKSGGPARPRLRDAVMSWLTSKGYAWREWDGVVCIDPQRN